MKSILTKTLTLATLALGLRASAQSYTNYWWTNTLGGPWATSGNWTNRLAINAAPPSSQTNVLLFNVGTTGYTASNNLTGSFALNQLVFGGTNVVLNGNPLIFTNNATVLPGLTNNALAGTGIISNSLVVASNLSFYGSGTAGVTIYGPVTTLNAVGTNSLTKNGTYPLTLAGTNLLGLIIHNGGTLTLAAGSTNFLAKGPITVNGLGAATTLNINGPTHIYPDNTGGANLQVGNNNNDRSLAVISANLTIGASIQLGAANVSTGAVYQTGGAVVSTYAAPGTGVFPIGTAANSYGYYRLTGGSVSASEIDIAVGTTSSGCFDILGGTVTPSAFFLIGRNTSPQFAAVNVWGGTLNAVGVTNSIGLGFLASQRGYSSLNIGNGGSVVVNPTKTLNLMIGATSAHTNTVTLAAGGTLTTPQVINGNPTATNRAILNFVGGTLQANTNSADFIKGLDTTQNGWANWAFVHDAGAVIDSQGFTITNKNPLTVATGVGLTKIPVSTQGAGYIAAPVVNITDAPGGIGVGATAIAQIDTVAQKLTNILVTCPGVGYSSPTVTLVGGGATTVASLGGLITGQNAGSGALTKLGSGTLVMMSPASTYGGNTTNSVGRLLLGTDNALSTNTLVMNGGTLGVNGGSWTLTNAVYLQAGLNNFEAASGTLTLSGIISGPNGLNKTGANVLYLTGANTFTGGVTNASTNSIVINNSSALGLGSKTVYLIPTVNTDPNRQPNLMLDGSSGAFALGTNINFRVSASTGAIINYAGDNVINGNISVDGGGGYSLLRSDNNSLTINGSINNIYTAVRQILLGGNSTGSGSYQGYSGIAGYLNGPVLLSASTMELAKQDSSTWVVTSTNTYNGGTYVNAGVLVLGATGSMTNSTPIAISSNAVFDVTAIGGFALTSGHTLQGNGDFDLGGTLVVSSNATINPVALNAAGGVVFPAGTLTLSNANVVLNGGSTLLFDLGDPTVAGGPLNDLVSIPNGNLTVTGPVIVNFGPFTSGNYQLDTDYPIITFSGSFIGSTANFTNTQNFRGGVVFSQSGQTIYARFPSVVGLPNAVTWKGDGVSNVWDLAITTNWVNSTAGTPDLFRTADSVTFDDSGNNALPITLVGASLPATLVTFNNATKNYTLTGTALTGYGRLEKDNSGTLTVANINTLTGGTTVNGGVLQVGNGTTITASVGPGQITNNATLIYSYGGGDPTFPNWVSGNGTWVINTDGGNRSAFLTGDNSGFTGVMYVTNGSQRLEGYQTNYGNPSMIYVANNGQIWPRTGTATTFTPVNLPVTISGMGCLVDVLPSYGALRLDFVDWQGPVTLSADASLGANANGSVSGNISGNYELIFAQAAGKIITLSGNNNNYRSTRIINATAKAGGPNVFSPGPLTMQGGALFLNGYSHIFTNLIGTTGVISNGAASTSATITVGGDNTSTVFGGTLVDGVATSPLGLTKIGSGELTLSGANTFSGGTVISSGSLAAVSSNALGVGSVTLNANSTLRVNSLVAGTANLLKIGGSGLTLNDPCTIAMSLSTNVAVGSSDFIYATNLTTGLTLSSGNSAQVRFDFSFPKGAPVLNSYYTLITNGNPTTAGSLPNFSIANSHYAASFTNTGLQILVKFSGGASNLLWTGDGVANAWKTDNTVSNWLNGVGKDYFGLGDSVTIGTVGSSNPVVNVTGNVLPSAITVDTSANNYTLSGSGKISGSTGLTKTGPGTLTMNVTNDFSGVITISNGTLSVPQITFGGAASPLGAASGASANLVLAGGNLQYTGPNAITDHGATLTTNSSIEVVSSTANLTNSGIIIGAAGSLKKIGAGTLVLSGANTYTGDSILDTGIVRLGNAAGLGGLAGTGYITNNGTLDVNGLVIGAKPFVVAGTGYNGQGVIDNSSATTTYAFTKPVTMVGDTTFSATGGRWDIRGPLPAALICSNNQPFSLTKLGTNMMVVAAGATVDTNLANIKVLAGTFSVEGVAGLGNPTNSLLVASNANFRIYTVTVPLIKNAYLTNASFEVNGGTQNLFAGPITLVSGSNAMNFSLAASTLTNSGPITGSGLLAQVNLAGSLYLLGTNTYTGGTLVNAGTMLGNIFSLQGNITNKAAVTVLSPGLDGTLNALVTGTGALNINSTNITVINTTHNFSGNLTLNAGMTALSLDNAIGIGTLNLNGGGLQSVDGNLRTVTNYFLISLNTTLGASGTGNLLFTTPQINNGGATKILSISNALTTITGSLTNTGALTKAGPGTLVLGSPNNIGALAISQGTLVLGPNASVTNAATIRMASETLLDGSAAGGFTVQSNQKLYAGSYSGDPLNPQTIVGNLTNNGDIYIADVGIGGYLGVGGGMTLNGGTLHYDLTDPSYSSDFANDVIFLNGQLSVTGPVIVDVPPVMPDGTYYLIQGITGWGSGSAANFSVPAGRRGSYAFADDGFGDLTLTVSGASGNIDVWQGYAGNTWDLSTLNWTNVASLMVTNFTQGDNAIFDDTALAFANATNVNFGANVLQPTTVIVSNNAARYTLIGTNGGGKLSGSSSIVKLGTGVLTIAATNDFYGSVSINQGLVVLGNTTSALGSPLGDTNRGSVIITNGGTLDLNVSVANVGIMGGRKLNISGAGYDGNGAVINNGPQPSITAIQNLILAGNATIGGSNRWDLRTSGASQATLNTKSNAFNLTKSGIGQISIVGATVDPYLADVNVQAGLLGFETTSTSLGNPTNTVTVQPGATFQFWAITNQLNKKIVLNGGGTLRSGSGASTVLGPVTLNSGAGTNILDTSGGNLSLLGPVGGSSGFTKLSANTLILGTNNTWAGGMTISNGTVQIGTNGLSGSPGLGDITNALTTGTLVYNVAASNVWNNKIQGGLGTLTVATNTGGLVLNGATYNVGQVNVNGGSLSLNGTMNVGTNSLNVGAGVAGQTALFQVVSGNFTNSGQNNIGTAANASGVINQTGGNFVTTGAMAFGGSIGNYGGYQISGGNASFGGDTQLGRGAAFNGGASLFTQTGGNVTSTSWFTIARDGGIGVLDLSGGTHFRPTSAANRFYLIGNSAGGFAQVTLRGTGTLDNEDNLGFSFSNPTSANSGSGMLNLNPGGTLIEKTAFTFGNSSLASVGYINFNGGTLRASGSSTTFLQGWTAAYVHSGGAFIDASNNSITIAQPLLVSSGNGVTSITASGSGFLTPPVVSISGGGGVGATALAQIDSQGNLTGVLISNPGENYTGTPGVAFLGGGGTVTSSTVAIGPNNTTGGLTKLGVGSLTLSGINTYTGLTAVNAGSLVLNGSTPGSATVNASGTLQGSGSLGGSVTVNTGGTLSSGSPGLPGTLSVGSTVFSTGSTNGIAINSSTAVGGGTNGLLAVNGNLTINSGTVVNFSAVGVPLVLGTPYTIITYTGSLTGSAANLSVSGLGARYAVTFANVPGTPSAITATINLSGVSGVTPLVWQGDGTTNQWSTAGYTNEFINSLGWTAFNNADAVQFGDTSLNLNVNLNSAVIPATVLVSSSNNYNFTGTGKLSGNGATLTKSGTGTLTVSTTNDYSGGTTISGGVVKLGVLNTVLGLPTGSTPLCVVTNAGGMAGAALDINGLAIGGLAAYTNPIVISGRSSTNVGAVYNSGTALGGGLGISNLVLAADAAIGNNGNRFDVTGWVNGGGKNLTELPGSGSYIAMYGGPVTNLNSVIASGLGATEFGRNVTSLGGAPVTNLSRVNLYQVNGYATPYGGVFSNSAMYMSNSMLSLTWSNGVWGGPITLMPGTTNTFDDGAQLNFGVAGPISGAGSLKKQNTKWLQLSGNNTYSGNTLVTAGQLVFASGSTLPSSPLFSVSSGSVLDFSLLGVPLSLGSGQTLSGSGMVSGEVAVNNGGMVSPGTGLGNAATLVLSKGYPFTLNSGSTLAFDLATTTTTGAGVNDLINFANGGALNLNGGNIFINPLSGALLSGGTYVLINNGSQGSGSAANLTLSSIVPINQMRQTFTLDSTSAPGGLLLNVTGGSGLGGLGGPLIWQGTNGANWDIKSTVNWYNSASSGADVFYLLDPVQFDDTGVGTVTLNGSLFPVSLLVSNNTVPYTFGGSGTITGAVAVVKAGSSVLTLNTPLNNTAATLVREGTIALGVNNALPNLPLQLGDRNSQFGAGLDLSLASQTIPTLSVLSTNRLNTNQITIGTGQTLTVAGNISFGPAITNAFTILAVSGGGSLVANTPTNNLTLVNAVGTVNTAVGGIFDLSALANLSLSLNSLNIGGGDNVGAYNSALLLATNSSLKVTNLTVGSSSEGSSMSLVLGSGNNSFLVDTFNVGTGGRDYGTVKFQTASGSVSLTNTTGTGRANLNIGALNAGGTTAYILTNVVDLTGHQANLYLGTFVIGDQAARTGYQTNFFGFDTGTLDVTNVIMARTVAANHNSYSAISISGGTVNIGAGGAMVASNAIGSLNISGGTVTLGADITKAATAGNGSRGTLNLTGGILDMQGNRIGGAIPIDVLNFQAGTLQNVAEINYGATVVKTGTGTLVIAGNNAYSGSTVVSNGTLLVNGTIGANTVTVTTGTTLGGVGTIGGPVTVQNGGTLAIGASLGTLTVNSTLALQAGSTNIMKIDKSNPGSHNDWLKGISTLTYGGTLNVVVTGPSLVAGDSFQLFTAGTIIGSFAATNLPALDPGLYWDTSALPTGLLKVASTTPARCQFSQITISAGSVTLSGTGGVQGSTYQVVGTPDLSQPLSAWIPVYTNTFGTGGSFNCTIPISLANTNFFFGIRQ